MMDPKESVPPVSPEPRETRGGETVRLAKEGILITILSSAGKLLGFLREWLVAYFFGAGIISDAYRVSVDFVRSITLTFAGQTVQMSLVPLLTRWRVRGAMKSRALLFRLIGWISLLSSLLLMLVLIIAGDAIARLQAPDYSSEDIAVMTMMLRWIAPVTLIFVAESMLTCLLMSVKRYRLIGYGTMVMNAFQIVAIVLIGLGHLPLQLLPISYWVSMIFVVGVLTIDARTWWMHDKVRIARKRARVVIRRFILLFTPLLLVGLTNQLRLFMDRRFVSEFSVGAIAALYFARFITETPQWTIGRTLSSMVLPHFSELAEMKNEVDFRRHYLFLLDFSLWLLMPLVVLCLTGAQAIIRLVYGYGAFDEHAVALSTAALMGAAPSIWTAVFHPLTNRVLIAQERSNMLLPFGFSLAILNIGLAWQLGQIFGILGVSVSLGISQFILILSMLPFLRLQVGAAAVARISLWFAWAVVLWFGLTRLPEMPPITTLLTILGILLPAWIGASFLFPHGKENMKRLGSILSRMMKK